MKREATTQEVILDELADVPIDAAVGLQTDQIGRHFEHICGVGEWLVDERHARVKDLLGRGHEALIAIFVLGVPTVDLAQDEVMIAVVTEVIALIVKETVEGIACHQLEIVFSLFTGYFPDLIEEKRRGNDCGPAVELEAIDLVGVGSATQFVSFLEKLDLVTVGCQSRSRTQSTEPTADDDNSLFHDRGPYASDCSI